MFGRKEGAASAAAAPQNDLPAPRREKVAPKDARCLNEGGTFAERKAQADAHGAVLAQRRLASLGATEFKQRNQRNGKVDYLPAELFYDVDHPKDRFVEIQGAPGMHALGSVDGRRDEVTSLPGRMTRRPGLSMMREPSPPDPPVRPV